MEIHPYIEKDGLKKQLNLSSEMIISEQYQDGGIWFPNTKVIICGTFPPKKEYFNRKGYIHYSSSKNKFWQHIDAIFNVNLYANKTISDNTLARIENSLKKVDFLRKEKIGFIDIFTKISRKSENSSKDDDIVEPYETFFETLIFENLIKSSVQNIIFVYSRSYNEFIKYLLLHFPDTKRNLVREYQKDKIPLRVESFSLGEKTIFLSYSPIHGKIEDKFRRPALKKAIENDYS
jgi:G:T/U-mismatch repair DNA glycosylase